MSDAVTVELRLCDDDGMVSEEIAPDGAPESYIGRLNRLKRDFASNWPETRYEGEPFSCSGSQTFPGVIVRCSNPSHRPVAAFVSVPISVNVEPGETHTIQRTFS